MAENVPHETMYRIGRRIFLVYKYEFAVVLICCGFAFPAGTISGPLEHVVELFLSSSSSSF